MNGVLKARIIVVCSVVVLGCSGTSTSPASQATSTVSASCTGPAPLPSPPTSCPARDPNLYPPPTTAEETVHTGFIPLIDMKPTDKYLGTFSGNLYDGGNDIPVAHFCDGKQHAAAITPLDVHGKPDPINGKIVLLSIGLSNTTQEFCSFNGTGGSALPANPNGTCLASNPPPATDAALCVTTTNGVANFSKCTTSCTITCPNNTDITAQCPCDTPWGQVCDSWSFLGQASAAASTLNPKLVIVNGAYPAQSAVKWGDPTLCNYDRVKNFVLAQMGGLTEAQVQVIWLKEADPAPNVPLPSSTAEAYTLETELGNIVRALKVRYTNLQQVFISSRIFAGYASTAYLPNPLPAGYGTSNLNPEPYAYESGFSVKWLVKAQIDEMNNNGTIQDTNASELSYTKINPASNVPANTPYAPWIGWGPYPWADGLTARSDCTFWGIKDFRTDDHTHPSSSGRAKVGTMLMNFFSTSPLTCSWFLAPGQPCPSS